MGDCVNCGARGEDLECHIAMCAGSLKRLVNDLRRSCQAKDIALNKEQFAHEDTARELKRWKDAVTDALVVDCVLSGENKNDPKKAINDLCCQAADYALDPRISEAAQKLKDAYKAERDHWRELAVRRASRSTDLFFPDVIKAQL